MSAEGDHITTPDHSALREETFFLDYSSPDVRDFISTVLGPGASRDPIEKSVALYYAIRDGIDYDVYEQELSRDSLRASAILRDGRGFCIHKSLVYAAVLRAVGIPSKLLFADVRNHLASARLLGLIGGEVFRFHAMTKVWLAGKWVIATPVFNDLLCRLYGFPALDFNGTEDSLLHPFGEDGNRSMEFLEFRGEFPDFPYDVVVPGLRLAHPLLFRNESSTRAGSLIAEAPRTQPK
jgi:transglutaminase-like putative cysteine protease